MTRMIIAATLMMLCIMVFQIPNAALGAYYTLLFSRDSARSTVRSVLRAVFAVAVSLVYVSITARMLAGEPFLHFVWVVGTLFLTFFLISALSEYLVGTAFGFLAVNSVVSWDFPANTDLLFANTLWTALAVFLGATITTAVELIFRSMHHSDEFTEQLLDRLATVEHVLLCLAHGRRFEPEIIQKLEQYAMTGTALLRQMLARSSPNSEQVAQVSTTVALAGRLVDLTAHVLATHQTFPVQEQIGFRHSADQLREIMSALRRNDPHTLAGLQPRHIETVPGSFLADIQATIDRIPEVYSGLESLGEYRPSDIDIEKEKPLFKHDAFTSLSHVRFALRGTLAAVACYVIYNSIEWHGLSYSVATCMVTALSTVGSSRQKQVLRVAGAVIGGFILGMGSQVFLLPFMDGIGEFTLLFVAVTAISAWIATSSPRISYAGVQTAFAFYVTQLRVFGPQTSLSVARDDVSGILFGLFMMWITFDRIWAKNASDEMIDTFVANFRRIACFDQAIKSPDLRTSINRAREERAAINYNFNAIRNVGDALLFEFGSGRLRNLQMRQRIRQWQPQLRAYFLLLVAFSHYRLQGIEVEPEAERNVAQSSEIMCLLADLEDRKKQDRPADLPQQINREIEQIEQANTHETEEATQPSQPVQLSRSLIQVAVSLAGEMTRPRDDL